MRDIPGFETFQTIKPIDKGQSNDKKYKIETFDGRRLLLRVTDRGEFDRKKAEYGMMERAYGIGVPTPEPLAFGLCNGEKMVYSLCGWLEGEDAEAAMSHMSEAEQYQVGKRAGAVLRKIHTLPAPDSAEPWDARFQRKVQTRVDLYRRHHLESEEGEKILRYLQEKQELVRNRPQTFWHGDFNLGNQILMPEKQVGVIDFNAWNQGYGDPWWEFIIIGWGEEPPAHYLSGMIDGYFEGDVPRLFFELLSYYYACDALSAVCYSFLGTEASTPEEGRLHMEHVLRWFHHKNHPIPSWYRTRHNG